MHWLKKQNNQKLFFGIFLFAIISSVLFVVPDFAMAAETVEADSCSAWSYVFCAPAKWMLYAIVYVMQIFASAGLVLFEYVIKPAHIIGLMNLDGVLQLWRFVRDFFNLFFILVLLFSAFATIFQVEQYSLKKIFLSVLLGALLINFSFPITRFLIDTTNVPMYYFANALSPNGTAGGAGQTAMGEVLKASQLTQILIPNDVTDTSFSRFFLAIIFMFLFAITIVVLAVMMFIRVIGLVILVIFSPVGFAASFIPGLNKYSSQWWEKFWSYALFGPSAMLMIFIAVKFMQAVESNAIFGGTIASSAANIASGSADQTTMASMVMFTLPIILIWMAIGTANSFSIAGAGAVTGWGQKIGSYAWKAPLKGGWAGAKFIGRKYEKAMTTGEKSRFTKFLAPSAVIKGIKDWREESSKMDKAPAERAAAGIQDKLNKKISRTHTNHEFEVTEHQAAAVNKELNEISDNSDYVIDEVKSYIKTGELEKVYGGIKNLAKNNNLNDLLMAEGEKYGADMVELKDENGQVLKDASGAIVKAVKISPENFKKVITGMLEASGEKRGSEKMAMKLMTISDVATASGNFGAGGMATFDDGHWKENSPEGQAAWAAGKVRNLESQERQRKLHPDSMYEYYIDPTTRKKVYVDLSTTGAAIAETFTEGDVDEARRSRDDNKLGMHSLQQMPIVPDRFGKTMAKNPVLEKYAKKVDAMYGQPLASAAQPTETPAEKTTRERNEFRAKADAAKNRNRA